MKRLQMIIMAMVLASLTIGCSVSTPRTGGDGSKIIVPCGGREDDDNDGVMNMHDECPNTEAGKVVNFVGCFIDGDDDNDGVLNSIDECPNTQANVEIDEVGCFIDGDDDNDGVLNSVDECPTTPIGQTVGDKGCFIDGDDDNDGVLNSMDECPRTKPGNIVDEVGCFIDGDDDNDGVLNSIDECPNTPSQVRKVDIHGCMEEVNLEIKFENKSYRVDNESRKNIQRLVDFLKIKTTHSAKIIGYTNSIGKKKDNQVLSENRAEAVRNIIVNSGISSSRVSSVGMGEENPIATNRTEAGRAKNRRIEAIITKN